MLQNTYQLLIQSLKSEWIITFLNGFPRRLIHFSFLFPKFKIQTFLPSCAPSREKIWFAQSSKWDVSVLLSESVKTYHKKESCHKELNWSWKFLCILERMRHHFGFTSDSVCYVPTKLHINIAEMQSTFSWVLAGRIFLMELISKSFEVQSVYAKPLISECLNTILETGCNLQFSVTGKSLVEPCHLTPMISLVGMERKVSILPCHRRATEHVNTV